MRKIALLCSICLLFVSTGCSMITTHSNYDTNEEFASYNTFSLHDGTDLPDNALNKFPQLRQYIDEIVRETLQGKGFIHKETGDTDFVVSVYGIVKDVNQNVHVSVNRGNRRASSISSGKRTAVELTQGALIIEVVNTMDKENKKLTWRSGGSRVIDEAADNDVTRKRLKKNIPKILADFPPN